MGPLPEMFQIVFQLKGPIFYSLLILAALSLLIGEVLFRGQRRQGKDLSSNLLSVPPDDRRLRSLWTAIPVFLLLCLTLVRVDKVRELRSEWQKVRPPHSGVKAVLFHPQRSR